MIQWCEIILSATVITVLVSVIVETLWIPILREKLLEVESIREKMIRAGYTPKSS